MKEMMPDVMIIWDEIKAIQHNNEPTSMTADEWRSLEEITRSTIGMHLAENVYFSMAEEMTINNIYLMGEAPDCLWEVDFLIKAHIYLTIVQYEDERDKSDKLPHQHLQPVVIQTLLPRD